jgi:ubiquinone biosynthesis O-methyltransferase
MRWPVFFSIRHRIHEFGHRIRLQSSLPAAAGASVDKKEADKFAALSAQWWDLSGPFATLHRFNPARCKFIRSAVCAAHDLPLEVPRPLDGLHALDVGCGGGILSESLARLGARVHAIDITEDNIHVAQQHAALDPFIKLNIRCSMVMLTIR